jgi:glycosyltransferase involved in cell wall biosynthesis
MKILIATGLSSNDVGGPAQYAANLKAEFDKLGHVSRIVKYSSIEVSFLQIWPHVIWADSIVALDTFSVGVPGVLAAKILRKKIAIRIGGDFLWSAYVNRTGEPITLATFYDKIPRLNLKEKFILFLTRFMLRNASYLAFNTEWQRNIWSGFYKIPAGRSGVIRNFIPTRHKTGGSASPHGGRNFLWAGRLIPEKNPDMLKKLGVEIVTGESHEKVLEKIKNSYTVVSLAFTDICPNFIIEAASFNKPFVMTRETGLSEIFPKGGIFVNPLDKRKIEEAMEAMLDQNTYNKHVEELKSLNLSHSWEEMAQEFINIWKRS